jgi:hypothetical protein
MRRRRFRTWAKWACTLAAVVAVGVAAVSVFYSGELFWAWPGGHRVVGLWFDRGLLCAIDNRDLGAADVASSWESTPHVHAGWCWGWSAEMRMDTGEPGWRAGVMYEAGPLFRKAGTSLLYPVLLTTIPAAFLWYKDRRPRGPHACKGCGYDRSGLPAEAKCPECGTVPARG